MTSLLLEYFTPTHLSRRPAPRDLCWSCGLAMQVINCVIDRLLSPLCPPRQGILARPDWAAMAATPFAQVPCGSGNALAASVGLWSVDTAVHAVIKGQQQAFDIASGAGGGRRALRRAQSVPGCCARCGQGPAAGRLALLRVRAQGWLVLLPEGRCLLQGLCGSRGCAWGRGVALRHRPCMVHSLPARGGTAGYPRAVPLQPESGRLLH